MSKIKNYLLVFMTIITNTSFASECTIEWSIKAKGISAGQTKEILTIHNDGAVQISSVFHPNSALRFFGYSTIERKFTTDNNKQAINRIEGNPEDPMEKKLIWKKNSEQEFYKWNKNEVIEKIDISSKLPIIDSTIFPYIPYLGMLENNKNKQVLVLSKNKSYVANISHAEHMLKFESENFSGYVKLDKEMQPNYFNLNQDGTIVEGTRTSWSCN